MLLKNSKKNVSRKIIIEKKQKKLLKK